MAAVDITLLGTFSVQCGGEEIREIYYDRQRVLLAYLLVENRFPHRREKLAALIWPDLPDDAARSNLRLAVFRLNRALNCIPGDSGGDDRKAIMATKSTLQIERTLDSAVDAIVLLEKVEQVMRHHPDRLVPCQECIGVLHEAVDLYHGDFLAGLTINSSAYLDWLDHRRDLYRHTAVGAIYLLIAYYAQQEKYAMVLRMTERLLSIEPWAEDVHRYQMYVLCLVGQHQSAIKHYEKCRKNLTETLNIQPSPETVRLYDQITRVCSDRGRFAANPLDGIQPVFIVAPE